MVVIMSTFAKAMSSMHTNGSTMNNMMNGSIEDPLLLLVLIAYDSEQQKNA